MISRHTSAFLTILLMTLFFGLTTAAAQNPPAGGAACDRACLAGFVTKYVDALIAHKPEALQIAPKTKFTED